MIYSTSCDCTAEDRISDYIALLKPKVMSLVVFSGLTGMVMAPGFEAVHPVLVFTALLSIAIGAGAAGAINMWYDRDIDTVMTRTKNRPIPAGRISADEALAFGIILSVMSVMMLALALNLLAAALLAFSIFFYAVIYTMVLKRRTSQNIVIGGAAGAFPPLIGYAAVTGDLSIFALALFALIFFWTPPHFWALALFIKDDYARAKVPMLPVTHGDRVTKIHMLAYTIILLPLSLVPFFLGVAGLVYAISATVLSGLFIISSIRVIQSNGLRPAREMFGFSILYLFVLFALMMMDKV